MKYLLVLCFVFEGLFTPPSQKQHQEFEYYLTSKETIRCVVIQFGIKESSYAPTGFDQTYVAATLSQEEIEQIEKIILVQIKQYNSENIKAGQEYWNIQNPEKYFKQIIAVLNKKGEKEVWVNFCCEVQKDEWKKSITYVDNGGQCYFKLNINLKTGVVTNFATNGVA